MLLSNWMRQHAEMQRLKKVQLPTAPAFLMRRATRCSYIHAEWLEKNNHHTAILNFCDRPNWPFPEECRKLRYP